MKRKSVASKILELSQSEEDIGLDHFFIHGVSIWRLIRFDFRINELKRSTGTTNKSKQARTATMILVKNIFLSFFDLFRAIAQKQKATILFAAFPRLTKIGNVHLDKFTDPIIQQLGKSDVMIYQRSLSGSHFNDRLHEEKVLKSDFINFTAHIGAIFTGLFLIFRYSRLLAKFFHTIGRIYPATRKSRIVSIYKLAVFFTEVAMFRVLLNLIRCECVVVVSRSVFFSLVVAAKKNKIKTVELQHGITSGPTALYSGKYNSTVDVDLFFTFGEYWITPFFGVPTDRVHNIGWAFKGYIDSWLVGPNIERHRVLLVSSPAITDVILELGKLITKIDADIRVDIRLHPQEALSENQKIALNKLARVEVLANRVDSTLTVASYMKIIGDHSTVLYEALSLNKVVGKLDMLGITCRDADAERGLGFYILSNEQDLIEYLQFNADFSSVEENIVYSRFDRDTFQRLIES